MPTLTADEAKMPGASYWQVRCPDCGAVGEPFRGPSEEGVATARQAGWVGAGPALRCPKCAGKETR